MYRRLTIYLLLLIVLIFNGSKEHGSLVREDEAILLEVFITGDEDGIEHGLVEQEVAHPFRDDDVKLIEGKLDFFELALDKGDLCG